jgi:SAM-dependent methyltransferase
MKLSELVELKQRLSQTFDLSKIEREIDALCSDLALLSNESLDKKYQDFLSDNIGELEKIVDDLDHYRMRLDSINRVIDGDISEQTMKFWVKNYETEFEYNDPNNIRKIRKLYIPKHAEPILLSRIGINVDWRYPTLEIGCRDGDWTQHLVAGDPLYIVDTHQEFIDSTVGKFTEEYQRRLRPYLIKDQNYSYLPQQQFGFIFSWNHFNYLSLDSIKYHLEQIYDLLRPGGCVLFTYNNGDLPGAAAHAEKYYMTYMPKSMLIPMCDMLGFELIDTHDFDPALSWIELKKPGELRTVKSHQVLGEIKRKHGGQSEK